MRVLSKKGIRKNEQTEMMSNNDLSVAIATQSLFQPDIDNTGLQQVLWVISSQAHQWQLD